MIYIKKDRDIKSIIRFYIICADEPKSVILQKERIKVDI